MLSYFLVASFIHPQVAQNHQEDWEHLVKTAFKDDCISFNLVRTGIKINFYRLNIFA